MENFNVFNRRSWLFTSLVFTPPISWLYWPTPPAREWTPSNPLPIQVINLPHFPEIPNTISHFSRKFLTPNPAHTVPRQTQTSPAIPLNSPNHTTPERTPQLPPSPGVEHDTTEEGTVWLYHLRGQCSTIHVRNGEWGSRQIKTSLIDEVWFLLRAPHL